jgi:hypothetical protein
LNKETLLVDLVPMTRWFENAFVKPVTHYGGITAGISFVVWQVPVKYIKALFEIKCKKRYRFEKATLYEREVIRK